MALTAGSRLGPYEIQSALGAGGMGEVYKARDTRLDRTVAIKVLPESLATDPQFGQRFDREARVISQLDHPHICALYDVAEEHGTSFLVMQYLDGDTLAARLEKGPLPLNEALTSRSRSQVPWMSHTARALCIAISSPAMSCSPNRARSCWTSAWRRPLPRPSWARGCRGCRRRPWGRNMDRELRILPSRLECRRPRARSHEHWGHERQKKMPS